MVAVMVLAWIFSTEQTERILTLSLLIACGLIGWSLGTALTPDTRDEARRFSRMGRAISLFLSGYLVSKLDRVIESVFQPATLLHPTDHLVAFRVVSCFSMVMAATLLVYFLRLYGFQVGVRDAILRDRQD
jgi:hypothetical protein